MALAASLQLQGTSVADLDEARRMIEPQIAGQLARSHRPEDLAALEAAIDLAAEAAEQNDPMAFGLAAAGVHDALVESSGQPDAVDAVQAAPAHGARLLHAQHRTDRPAADAPGGARLPQAAGAHRAPATRTAAIAHWDATMRYTINARDPDELVTALAVE